MTFDEWLMHMKRLRLQLLCVSKTYAEEGPAESQCILGELEYFDKAINGDIKARELLEKEFNKEVAA